MTKTRTFLSIETWLFTGQFQEIRTLRSDHELRAPRPSLTQEDIKSVGKCAAFLEEFRKSKAKELEQQELRRMALNGHSKIIAPDDLVSKGEPNMAPLKDVHQLHSQILVASDKLPRSMERNRRFGEMNKHKKNPGEMHPDDWWRFCNH